MQFTKATKAKARARVAVYGPAGSGKTYTSLSIATGMVAGTDKRIAVIDTEHGSASKYADRFDFDTLHLSDHRMEAYTEAMRAAAEEGYGVIVIDSISHGWQKMLEEVDTTAKASRTGNSFAAWRDHTPRQKRFVEAILSSECHIIATIRAQTEWVQEANDRGKTAPRRIGLKPEQGKGIEYEFDILMQLSAEHVATIEKDRSGKYQDTIIDKPGVEFGKSLVEWLSDGVDAPAHALQSIPSVDGRSRIVSRLVSSIAEFCGVPVNDKGLAEKGKAVMEWLGYKRPVSELGVMDMENALATLAERVADGATFETITVGGVK